MPSHMDEERQGTERQRLEEWREEQRDWLNQNAEEMGAQTALLQRIARHTGLVYLVTIVGLVVGFGWLLVLLVHTLLS